MGNNYQNNQLHFAKIPEIFENMSYGANNYETKNGFEWLKNKDPFFAYIEKPNEPIGIPMVLENTLTEEKLCIVNVSEIDAIQKILINTKQDAKWFKTAAPVKSKTLYRLGQEIEKNKDLFAEIELLVRGIIPTDTKNNIPLLAQYFYYYSTFAVVYSQENKAWEPPGISFGFVSNENNLSTLGLYLAPALAAGYNIVLQTGTKMAPSAFLLLNLAKNVGIGQDIIRIIPSDDQELMPYFNSDNVSIISLFTNIYNGKFPRVNHTTKKVLALCPFSLPVLVFDHADLDSACESIASTFWESTRTLTGCESYIFVQENILSTFLNKLINKLKKVKIGRADEKGIDIAYPITKSLQKFNDILTKAKAQGYQICYRSDDSWSPALLIGNRTFLNLNDDDHELQSFIAYIVSFRSTVEAVDLANNLKYGMGISLWSENLRINKDVVKKIEATNIWINKSPYFAANITFSPMKKSGCGYFGGKEGFYEYVDVLKPNPVSQRISTSTPTKISNIITKSIEVAQKAQVLWRNVDKLKQINIFQKVVEYLEDNKSTLSGNKEKECCEVWISSILECVADVHKSGASTFEPIKNVLTLHVPKGVLVIAVKNNWEQQNIKLITAAISEGNTVIVVTDSEAETNYFALSKLFPTGVLNICSVIDAVFAISGRKDVKIFIGNEEANPVFTHLSVVDNTNEAVTHSRGDIFRKVTFAKNVWN